MADWVKNILVSLCNFEDPRAPQLFLLDRDRWGIRPLELPPNVPKGHGITGLTISDKYIFAATQLAVDRSNVVAPLGRFLLILDRNTLDIESYYRFRRASDVHAICLHEESLLVTSTATDEVIRLRLSGSQVISEEVWWRLDPAGLLNDIHHINGICSASDRVITCGFGKRTGVTWDSAPDGFLYDITRKVFLARGLRQPHTVAALGSNIFFCESRPMYLHKLGDPIPVKLNGYTRGICFVDGRIYAASSTGRKRSRSTGNSIEHAPGQESEEGECAIWELDLNMQVIRKISIISDSTEIFDLLPL